MTGWRAERQRCEEETIPADALQKRGKEIEQNIRLLKEEFPNWAELDQTHDVRRKLQELEGECRQQIFKLVKRGIKATFDCGQPQTESRRAQERQNRVGRPRKDGERELIRKKKDAGKSWKEIANEVNRETGQQKTADACRSLLRNHSGTTKLSGKNEQN